MPSRGVADSSRRARWTLQYTLQHTLQYNLPATRKFRCQSHGRSRDPGGTTADAAFAAGGRGGAGMFRQRAFLAGGGAVCGLGAAVVASSARGWDQSKKQGDEKGSAATTRPYQCTKTTASAQLCSVVRIENFLSDEEIQRVIGWWIQPHPNPPPPPLHTPPQPTNQPQGGGYTRDHGIHLPPSVYPRWVDCTLNGFPSLSCY